MRRSLNEISGEIRKASLGAGFPMGHAQEISHAAAWLISRNLDGVKSVLNGLRGGFKPITPPLKFKTSPAGKKQYFLPNVHAASHGVGLRDMMIADAGQHRFQLDQIDVPLLLIGLLGAQCDDQNYEIWWGLEHEQTFSLHPNVFESELKDFALKLETHRSFVGLAMVEPSLVENEQLQNIFSAPEGYLINEILWLEIKSLAAKTYVPASEASRTKGAGAAINDND